MRKLFWNGHFRNHVENSKTHRDSTRNKKHAEDEGTKNKGSDNPSWPIGLLKENNYRLAISMAKINLVEDSGGYKIELKDYGILKTALMFAHLSSVQRTSQH